MKLLNEMAMTRPDAIDICISLGKKFIEHYHKIYLEPSSQSRNHWITEMQNWYDKVKQIKLKQNTKPLLTGQIRDWFLTAGAYPEDFVDMDDTEQQKYDEFCLKLLANNSVEESLK